VLGGQRQLIALLGEGGELEVCAEVIGAEGDGVLPTLDSGGERGVDVLEGLGGSGVAGLAEAIEDAAGLGLLLRLITKEGVLEGHLDVGGVKLHGFAELSASEVVLTDL